MLVHAEDFPSDDVFALFFTRFSGKCWSLVNSFLSLDYKQTNVCVASGPVLARWYIMEIRTGRCGLEPSASSQGAFGLVVCFFFMLVALCLIKEGDTGDTLDLSS